MSKESILSIFSGLGLLDWAFECAGFTVVRGPDILWNLNIKNFDARPLRGMFAGVIGGIPCQYASVAVKHEHKRKYENLWPEFWRVVSEVSPIWVLGECVPPAKSTCISLFNEASMGASYRIIKFADLGSAQNRTRLIVFKGPRQDEFWRLLDEAGPRYGREWRERIGREPMEAPRYNTIVGEGAPFGGKYYTRTLLKIDLGNPRYIKGDELLDAFDLPADWDIPIYRFPNGCKARMLSQGVPLAAGYALARTVKEITGKERRKKCQKNQC